MNQINSDWKDKRAFNGQQQEKPEIFNPTRTEHLENELRGTRKLSSIWTKATLTIIYSLWFLIQEDLTQHFHRCLSSLLLSH